MLRSRELPKTNFVIFHISDTMTTIKSLSLYLGGAGGLGPHLYPYISPSIALVMCYSDADVMREVLQFLWHPAPYYKADFENEAGSVGAESKGSGFWSVREPF